MGGIASGGWAGVRYLEEADFWLRLEYRVCGEIAGLSDRSLRYYGCDGFIPQQYVLADANPRVIGRAWIGNGGRDQQEWTFELLLSDALAADGSIDWQRLLPPPNVTRWLTLDRDARRIVLEPLAAVPDSR